MKRLIALGAVLMTLTACGTPESRAHDDADESAAQAVDKIHEPGLKPTLASLIAEHAVSHGYEVLKVEGVDVQAKEGVTLTVRISGYGSDGAWIYPEYTEFAFCYELWFGHWESHKPKRVPCPQKQPLPLPPKHIELPSTEDLEALLNRAGPDAEAIRAGLDLDPAVRVQVFSDKGFTGIALKADNPRVKEYDCVLARTGHGITEAWVPARAYRQSGEMDCSGSEAAHGAGQHPPH